MKRFLTTAAWVVFWVTLTVLFVLGLAGDIKARQDHNNQQIAECRAMGGFARTTTDGWLSSCTFPIKTRGGETE
jgi:hypothetical protein